MDKAASQAGLGAEKSLFDGQQLDFNRQRGIGQHHTAGAALAAAAGFAADVATQAMESMAARVSTDMSDLMGDSREGWSLWQGRACINQIFIGEIYNLSYSVFIYCVDC